MNLDIIALKLNQKRNSQVIHSFVHSNSSKNKCVKKRNVRPFKSVSHGTMPLNITVDVPDSVEIKTIIEEILKKYDKANVSALSVLNKIKMIKRCVLIALWAGVFSGFSWIFIRESIDMYLFCFLMWILCCTSLWVTLKYIIRDWEKNKYVQ